MSFIAYNISRYKICCRFQNETETCTCNVFFLYLKKTIWHNTDVLVNVLKIQMIRMIILKFADML